VEEGISNLIYYGDELFWVEGSRIEKGTGCRKEESKRK